MFPLSLWRFVSESVLLTSIYVKQHLPKEDFMWKFLCVVYDNEALGLIERLLQSSEITFKIEPMPAMTPKVSLISGDKSEW